MKTIHEYQNIINCLPTKTKYTKEDLLIPELLVDKKGSLEIYYAPHNEYINSKAKIFIVGITPGFEQMNISIVTAKNGLNQHLDMFTIQQQCKWIARFSGSLRKNLINMLDEIELNHILQINSCQLLFEPSNTLLHTTSLIPYPTFINKQNYSGHSPKLLSNKFLMPYVYSNLTRELSHLSNDILIIPLGIAVESVLVKLVEDNLLSSLHILTGFPHPSGANRNRTKQLAENKESLKLQLREVL